MTNVFVTLPITNGASGLSRVVPSRVTPMAPVQPAPSWRIATVSPYEPATPRARSSAGPEGNRIGHRERVGTSAGAARCGSRQCGGIGSVPS